MYSPHLPFNTVVMAVCVGLIAQTVPNIYFYQNLYNGGGTPTIGKTSAGVMLAFNILALVAEVCLLVWSVIRIFTDKHHKKSSFF